MGKVIEVGGGEFQAAQEVVVNQHRRHRDGNPDTGGHQRRADWASHGFKAGRARGADALERFHDAPDRTEQTDEG
ncbi:hypothetical protein D3C77_582930 [compost metagenome]